jgi:hypothetical protein
VPHDDLFPIELLRLQAQESILAEFGGRRPTMSEVARIPDDHLMKLSGFGPSTIRKVRSITQRGIASSSEVAGSSDAELRTKHDRNYPGPCANWDSLIPWCHGSQRS